MKSNKSFSGKLVLILCLAQLISFLVYYFTTYVFASIASSYIFYFYTEIVRTVVPIVSALALFVTYAKESLAKCFLRALSYALPWIIYILPYNAYKYAYGGLVIEEVIRYAILETLFVLAMLYITILILSFVMMIASYVFIRAKKEPFKRQSVLSGKDPLDFATPSSVGIFSGCFVPFLYNLIREIKDTSEFIEYANGVYMNSEIIYMVIKYVFILGLLLLSYFTSHKLKKIFSSAYR